MSQPACRFCAAPLTHSFADLGMSPPSNAFLRPEQLGRMEKFYPLHAWVCGACFLVQLEEFESPEQIFSADYAYFSSYSDSWLAHARAYTEMATARFGLGKQSKVVEIASNDGYLLQYFAVRGIPVLGIEPAANVAKVAEQKGVPSLVKFFGAQTARDLVAQGVRADLLLGNNVLAHVPDLNDFVAGLKILLAPGGAITMEFPHLLRLMLENQFDTIYHEHFSYFSFITVQQVFARHGLILFDVEELSTHGGSLRIYARHEADAGKAVTARCAELLKRERAAGLDGLDAYRAFAEQVKETKRHLLEFLIGAKRAGKRVVGYGAAAKGNTLLNYCGIRTDFIDYVVDRSPHKQGCFLPGVHIPVHGPERIAETRPDYLLILPWNLKDEIVGQMAGIRAWGGRFVVPIPQAQVLD
jgi:2-polyprenyl-3-methyl-5-hydroxy-6-metoxy-1,4-benzoquinol methylase